MYESVGVCMWEGVFVCVRVCVRERVRKMQREMARDGKEDGRQDNISDPSSCRPLSCHPHSAFDSLRQLRGVMHGAVAVVIEGEVEPLLVRADEAIGVVHAAFGAID